MVLGQYGASPIPHRQTDFECRATQPLKSTRNAISPGGRPRRPLSWTLPHQHQCSEDDQVKEDYFIAGGVELERALFLLDCEVVIIDNHGGDHWWSRWWSLIIMVIIIDNHGDDLNCEVNQNIRSLHYHEKTQTNSTSLVWMLCMSVFSYFCYFMICTMII